jgi:DNA-binding MarR family transcriptional regulator
LSSDGKSDDKGVMQGPITKQKSAVQGEAAARTAAPRAKAGAKRLARAPEAEEVILAPALSAVTGYLIRRAHNTFQGYWMSRFRESDTPITPVQGGILVVLGANPGLTQTALARMMKVEGPTLMQSVDRLEQQGYVQRMRRPGDRRSYSLQLTPLGERVLASIDAFLPVRDADLLDGMTPEEVATLQALLTRIVERGNHLRTAQAAPAEVEPSRGPKTGKRGPALP